MLWVFKKSDSYKKKYPFKSEIIFIQVSQHLPDRNIPQFQNNLSLSFPSPCLTLSLFSFSFCFEPLMSMKLSFFCSWRPTTPFSTQSTPPAGSLFRRHLVAANTEIQPSPSPFAAGVPTRNTRVLAPL